MRRATAGQLWPVVALLVLVGCSATTPVRQQSVRSESVDQQQLQVQDGGGAAGSIQPYALGAGEGYRMPRLLHAPPPVLGDADPRQELPPTQVCLQVVVDAEGRVERSLPLTSRADCVAGAEAVNAPLLQAAQRAVDEWAFAPAGSCRFAAGQARPSDGSCGGASEVTPVAVSLVYAFTFRIEQGMVTVQPGR